MKIVILAITNILNNVKEKKIIFLKLWKNNPFKNIFKKITPSLKQQFSWYATPFCFFIRFRYYWLHQLSMCIFCLCVSWIGRNNLIPKYNPFYVFYCSTLIVFSVILEPSVLTMTCYKISLASKENYTIITSVMRAF